MSTHPAAVLDHALRDTHNELQSCGLKVVEELVRQLAETSCYAEVAIVLTASITDSRTDQVVASTARTLPFKVFWSRDPHRGDGTE